MKVRLRTLSVAIQAPRPEVFKLISSFGDGEPDPFRKVAGQWTNDMEEGKTLVERDGNRLLMEFRSRDGRKMYRTLEEVMLYPDERITFRHLEGPLNHSQEEFRFTDTSSGTSMTQNGEIECRMHWLSVAGWVVARFYVKRHYEHLVPRHMNDLKERAEGTVTH